MDRSPFACVFALPTGDDHDKCALAQGQGLVLVQGQGSGSLKEMGLRFGFGLGLRLGFRAKFRPEFGPDFGLILELWPNPDPNLFLTGNCYPKAACKNKRHQNKFRRNPHQLVYKKMNSPFPD